MTGHIFIEKEIGTNTTPDTVREQIKQYPQASEWMVHFNSGGGDVYDGYQIGVILKNLGHTTAIIEGVCASIATYAACSCDHVIMSPAGDFMIHLPTGTLNGTADDFRKGAAQLDRIKSELIDRYMSRVAKKGVTREQLSHMIDEETSMSPSEALQMGFVDEVREKLKAVASIDIKKFENMNMTEEQKGWFEKIGAKLDALLAKNIDVKNAVQITLADGTMVNSDAATADAIVGSMLTDEAGAPLPDGTYETIDGLALVVAGGKVASADPIVEDKKDDSAKQIEALNAEIAALKQQLAEKAQATEAQAKETAQFKNALTTLKSDFDKLKNETFGDPAPPKDAPNKMDRTQKDPMLEAMSKQLGEAFLTSRFK